MKQIVIITLLLFTNTLSNARVWVVNSADFEFSMQVICVAVVDGTEMSNTEDLVGAFVGDECRGFIQPTYIEAINRSIFYLPVMSNVASGETISFKMFDSQNNRIIDALNTVSFEVNKETGSAQNPFMLSNDVLKNGLEMNVLNFVENMPVSSIVANFATWYNGKKVDATYSLLSGVSDNSSFGVFVNNLVSNELFDFETKSIYSIRVRSVGTSGTFEESFALQLSDVNEVPEQLMLDVHTIAENSAVGSVVGSFSTVDEDDGEIFTYSLNEQSDFFMVDGNQLKTKVVLNYEEKSSYAIEVKVMDSGDNTLVQNFQIELSDENDLPSDILIFGDTIASGLPTGSIIGHLHVSDEDKLDEPTLSLPLNELDNNLFRIQPYTHLLLSNASFDETDGDSKFIRVKAADGNGGILQKDVEINIVDKGYVFKEQEVIYTFAVSDFVVHTMEVNGSTLHLQIDPLQRMGKFRVSCDVEIKAFILFDSSGSKLKSGNVNALSFEINANDLATDIYYLSIETDKGVVNEKMVVL